MPLLSKAFHISPYILSLGEQIILTIGQFVLIFTNKILVNILLLLGQCKEHIMDLSTSMIT
jgi:hypothetical protein